MSRLLKNMPASFKISLLLFITGFITLITPLNQSLLFNSHTQKIFRTEQKQINHLFQTQSLALQLLFAQAQSGARKEKIQETLKSLGQTVYTQFNQYNSKTISPMDIVFSASPEAQTNLNAFLIAPIISQMNKLKITPATILNGKLNSFFYYKNKKELLSWIELRNLLLQDPKINKNIQFVVSIYASLTNPEYSQLQKMQMAIVDEIIDMAQRNNVSTDFSRYNIDIASLLTLQGLIQSRDAQIINLLREYKSDIYFSDYKISLTEAVNDTLNVCETLTSELHEALSNGSITDSKISKKIETSLELVFNQIQLNLKVSSAH